MNSLRVILRRLPIVCLVVTLIGGLVSGCSGIRKLNRENPDVKLQLPARSSNVATPQPSDTVQQKKIITFRKQDGTELFFTPIAVDTLTGEKMMSVSIDEVVVLAATRRNLVERNGKINVEFVVTLPEAYQNRIWRMCIDPQLRKGPDTLHLDPLVYSGDKFRRMQEGEYNRYERYQNRIVDSADYFERFGQQWAFDAYMADVAKQREKAIADGIRLDTLTPRQAMYDGQVGWFAPTERSRHKELLRWYVRSTDRKMNRNNKSVYDPTDSLYHLRDYFTPRYDYPSKREALPGGAIYTRVDGVYPDTFDQEREIYLRDLKESRDSVRRSIRKAPDGTLCDYAEQRAAMSGKASSTMNYLMSNLSDEAVTADYQSRRNRIQDRLDQLNSIDSNEVRRSTLNASRVARNEALKANREAAFKRIVPHPYVGNARLDTVIRNANGNIQYFYSEQVQADENTSKLILSLAGEVESRGGRRYRLRRSDTLTYNVASMATFVDTTTRYMQRIVLRDAEANARFFFTFPVGKAALVDTLPENRSQLRAVRELTRGLMTDPVYIIDSITLRATSSPEGVWRINEQLAHDRAESLREVLVSEFRTLYDSLRIAASYTLDETGNVVMTQAKEGLPNLPELLRTQWLAEDWDELRRLVLADTVITDKEDILSIMREEQDPDRREWRIRRKHPAAYERMHKELYPKMRAVDFRFNLHRRGMLQDTVYTTEVDTAYMRAVDLLKKRRYEEALVILRPYEDRNTALAYMSVGYDRAAYRILRGTPEAATSADLQYMLAILAARLGEEEQAVQYFLRSVELRENLKFRGNLDPEISRLIRKYGLFKEDFM